MARDAGPAGTAVLCLALIAAASAALAAGGPVQEAHAQDLILEPLGSLQDVSGNSRELDGASGVDVFTIGNSVYAVVAGHNDHGIQIVGLDNPGHPQPTGRLGDGSAGHLRLAFPRGVEVFERGGSTYAAVVGEEDAVQVVDISDPASPRYTASLVASSGLLLRDSFRAAAFERGSNTFLAVPSPTDNGLQIVEVTNVSSPNPFSRVEDNNDRLLRGASGVDIFERGGKTYAAVASRTDDGIQLVDITNHHHPAARGTLGELYSTPDARELDGAFDVAVFERGDRTYAAVTGYHDDGLQIVDVSDPNAPLPVGRLPDTDDLRLRAPTGIDAFRIGAYSYVAVASDEDALQIVDVSDPHSPAGAGKLADGGDLLLWDTNDVKVFERGGNIYAAVTSYREDGIQIVRISHPDGLPPELKSAALDWGTRILEITFDEAIDVSETRLSRMSVPVPGGSSIPLAGAAVRGGDSATVSVTLTKSQTDQIVRLDSPRISVEGGAVSDLAGNTRYVVQSAGISVTGSDTEKPVITLVGDRSVAVELGGTYTELGASVSDNDPTYAETEATVGGDAVDAGTAGVYTVRYTAPADGAGNAPDAVERTVTVRDTTPPVITLVGDRSVAVELGGTYAEQGAAVSDNDPAYATTAATVGGDAVDAGTAGVYTVRYTAPADGAGNAPDPVSRTVTVRDPPPAFVSATLDTAARTLTLVFDEIIDVSEIDFTRITIGGLQENGNNESVNLAYQSNPAVAGGADSETLVITGVSDAVFDIHNITHVAVNRDGVFLDLFGNGMPLQNFPLRVVDAQPDIPCAPPPSGHWDIRDSCALASDTRAPAGITVHAPATLVIPAGVTLDVDFERHGLLVREGAGLLIQQGGGMK